VIASVAVFGVGFIARPLGGVLIGAYADRAGRKAALTLSLALMTIGTALMVFTPSYASIGMAAPVLVVIARLLQGFSAGGEIGPATTFLLEIAAQGKRGFYTSWQLATQGIAALLGGLVGYIASSWLSTESMAQWGWRIPFVLGLLIAPVGLYIRRNLHETLDEGARSQSLSDLTARIGRRHLANLLIACTVLIGPTITVYVVGNYMATYGMRVLHLPAPTAMLVGLINGFAGIVVSLIAGTLYDRAPGSKLMLLPQLLTVVLVVPLFSWVTGSASTLAFLSMVAILSVLRVAMAPFQLCFLPEIFPKEVRSTCISVCFSLPTTIFGGSAQVIVAGLMSITGNPMVPAWYLVMANLISLVGAAALYLRNRNKIADGGPMLVAGT
jgi:MFS family permease